MNSLNRTARLAGILTLLTAVLAPFSMVYLPSTLIVSVVETAFPLWLLIKGASVQPQNHRILASA